MCLLCTSSKFFIPSDFSNCLSCKKCPRCQEKKIWVTLFLCTSVCLIKGIKRRFCSCTRSVCSHVKQMFSTDLEEFWNKTDVTEDFRSVWLRNHKWNTLSLEGEELWYTTEAWPESQSIVCSLMQHFWPLSPRCLTCWGKKSTAFWKMAKTLLYFILLTSHSKAFNTGTSVVLLAMSQLKNSKVVLQCVVTKTDF